MSLKFIDIFCGAGGSSLGLTAAGMELTLAANHWDVAINTHAANFPDAEHLCADVNNYDMRRLPPARVLWASPICTEATPAGGRRKRRGATRAQAGLDLLTPDQRAEYRRALNRGWERTRATAYDVIRATEVWAYDVVLIENVIEFATDWPLFDWWLEGMGRLGYTHHIVCVNSAHIGGDSNPAAPQWRDRLYIVFTHNGIKPPDLQPRPLAHCFDCGTDVHARQTWKAHTRLGKLRLGKYREQYTYTCPNTARRHDNPIVEPYVRPAATAIDWTDLGTPIGQRTRPLAASTMARIRTGLAMVTHHPVIVQVNHAGHNGRAYPATQAPLAARTARGGDGMVIPPYVVELRGGGSTARPAAHPLGTITAGGNHHALITPTPTGASTDRHALVIPYRRGNPKTTAEPLHTIATKESAALLQPEIDIDACRFRMLRAREHLRAQRFPDTYTVTGTQADQTMQAGNAVSANVVQWIGGEVMQTLT